MDFEWDEEKRHQNIRKHGIDFLKAKTIWCGDVVEYISLQDYHGEERWMAMGELNGDFVTVVFTWRGVSRRLISARKARRYEQEDYENEVGRGT